MALEQAVLNAAADGATALLAWAAIHDGAGSGDEVSAARQQISWDPATGAVATAGTPLEFAGTPGGPASHLGVWSAQTGGTFLGAVALTGDQTFNAAGEYTVTALTLAATDET